MDVISAATETPMDIRSIDVRDRMQTIRTSRHTIKFLKAEWWVETSHFVLLKYALDGVEQEAALRMDVDKQAIIDDFRDAEIRMAVRERTPSLWQVVVQAQRDAVRSF